MPHASLFGVPIAWSCEGLARQKDPLAELLAPVMSEGAGAQGKQSRIEVVIRPASVRTAADPREDGYFPSFFQGVVQAYTEGGPATPPVFLLWDRASRARVPLDGSAIEAEIAPTSKEITPGSAGLMLQIAFALALRREGLFHLHAAAVVHPSGAGALIVGSGGAGKTTTTLALLTAGYDYVSDDVLFLRETPTGPEILGFPRMFHVGPATLSAFPGLRPLVGEKVGAAGKRPLDAREAFPGRERPKMGRPAIALFPRVDSASASALRPLSKADGFGHLIPSSAAILIDGVPGREANMTLLRAILERAPCFELILGHDLLKAPADVLAPKILAALDRSSDPAKIGDLVRGASSE